MSGAIGKLVDETIDDMATGATVTQLRDRLRKRAEVVFLPRADTDAAQIRRALHGARGVFQLQENVALIFGYTRDDLLGKRRWRNLSLARQVCCYLLRSHWGYSFPEIGRIMGIDHTSARTAAQHVGAILHRDTGLAADLERIVESCR